MRSTLWYETTADPDYMWSLPYEPCSDRQFRIKESLTTTFLEGFVKLLGIVSLQYLTRPLMPKTR